MKIPGPLSITATSSSVPVNGIYSPLANELDLTTSGVAWVDATTKVVAFKGALSGITSGSGDCGTAPAISGSDTVGRVTVGSSTNGGKCTVVFASTKTTAPVCTCNDETNASDACHALGVSTTSAALTATTSYVAGGTIGYHCYGYQQ